MILVDTSVWIDLWRRGNAHLTNLLEQDRAVVHPFVLGELALGRLARRADVLRDLQALQAPRVAEHSEVLSLIDRVQLWGQGIGWVDVHLLASTLLDGLRLWTLDQRLATVAANLGVAVGPGRGR